MLAVRALFTEYATDAGGPVKAAQDVSFEVPRGKLFTLLGPSGCGKTTTLALDSRTGEADLGRDRDRWARSLFVLPKASLSRPNKRNFGMVFQSYAIWPHMNVFQNVAFPLQVRRLPKKLIREKVMRDAQRGRARRAGRIATRPSSPAASSSGSRSRAHW